MSTQSLISIRCILRLFGCMYLGLIARGYGLTGPSAKLLRATLLASLTDLVDACLLGFFWGMVAGSV
jgi:hypothetical protein